MSDAKITFAADATAATLINGEGTRITMSVRHGDATIAEMHIQDTNGNWVAVRLNKDNRYRLRNILNLMDC